MVIDIAKEFSPYPSGRVPADGTFNGETFRREHLVPAIRSAETNSAADQTIIVDINGVRSFGSSFLEEAFGGLERERDVDMQRAYDLIEIRCSEPHLQIFKDAIEDYLEDALAISKKRSN